MSAVDTELPWIPEVRETAERIWDRIDAMLLRLQGRVDTPAYDRWIPWVWSALMAVVLASVILARHFSLRLGTETAKYAQAVWQISEGLKPDTTLAEGHILAEQASFILYPLSLITAILPRTETLLTLKAIALAFAIVPLWRLARRHGNLAIGATSAVVFAYSLYSATHAMNAADFAPAILAVPALLWAVLYGFDERQWPMVVSLVFALCCRADLGLVALGLGILLVLERRRRVGTIAGLLGLGWFLIAMYAVQPAFGDGYAFLEPYFAFGETPMRALFGIIRHPIEFAGLVFEQLNFLKIVSLLAPVLFLPLTAPRYLMPAVPLYVLYIGADVEEGLLREAAQTVPITVFVFVATVFALRNTGRVLVKLVRVDRRVVVALLLTAIVFFVADSSTSPYKEPWQWNERTAIEDTKLEAIALLEDDTELVRASSTFLPLLSERLGVYAVNAAQQAELNENRVEAAIEGVDWLLLDPDGEAISEASVAIIRAGLLDSGWEPQLQDSDSRIEVWRFTGVLSAGSR